MKYCKRKSTLIYFVYGLIATTLVFKIFKDQTETAIFASSVLVFSMCLIRLKLCQKIKGIPLSFKYILVGMVGWLVITIALIIYKNA